MSIVTLSLVHPCDEEGNGGCDQICKKVSDKAECGCREGFKLVHEEEGEVCKQGMFYHSLLSRMF